MPLRKFKFRERREAIAWETERKSLSSSNKKENRECYSRTIPRKRISKICFPGQQMKHQEDDPCFKTAKKKKKGGTKHFQVYI